MDEPAHQPRRPDWTCGGDHPTDTPWPCDTARVALAEEYTGHLAGLTAYMAQQWTAATVDLGDTEAGTELYERFLAWPRQAAAR